MIEEDLTEIDSIDAAQLDDGKLVIVRDEKSPAPWEEIKPVMQDHNIRPLGFEELDGKPVTVAVLHKQVAEDHLDWYDA